MSEHKNDPIAHTPGRELPDDVVPLSVLYKDPFTQEFKLIIESGTLIPVTKTLKIKLGTGYQHTAELILFQGEVNWGDTNKLLGSLHLEKVPEGPDQTATIIFSFKIDDNGILSVTAKNSITQEMQAIKIEAGAGISKMEVEEMKKANLNSDK